MHAIRTIAAVVSTSTVFVLGAWRAPKDACSLLTQTEVNSVVGLSLQAGAPQGTPVNCAWIEPQGPSFTNKRVDLTVQDQQGFAIGKMPGPKKTITPVTGIGDDAYYVEAYGLTTLSVKKGPSAFVICVRFGTWSTDQRKTMEKVLAQTVLVRF